MSPIPELNLSLGMTDNPGSPFYAGNGEIGGVSKTDSGLRTHKISLTISDLEIGKITLTINKQNVEIPTYKMIVSDDKTNETTVYQVTRDMFSFVKKNTKKGILSFFGFKNFDKTSFLYENIPYEPADEIEILHISKYRNISHDSLIYQFNNPQKVYIFSGNINEITIPENNPYFIIIDNNDGKSFIGDILYREKFLKLTPRVELKIIKRNKIPKEMEINENGSIQKLIYL
ncbi:hypothetical protein [Flavobacterium columnare]|uniref:Uncharacterized protein n=1 Tax=Flavobacterium columnare TaxID=996 RepID=A0AA94EXB8_9FLAO|nr:hypothetical protein [Flavobacterium columnare]MCH4829584.1 hypothetical protein [Flavobacterium columnare]MCH4831419.1 hypothetical protein [Flavobacterium columnare]